MLEGVVGVGESMSFASRYGVAAVQVTKCLEFSSYRQYGSSEVDWHSQVEHSIPPAGGVLRP